MHKAIKVLIFDDVALIRSLVSDLLHEDNLLHKDRSIATTLEAADMKAAVTLMAQHRPQIAILDIAVPAGCGLKNGVDLLRMIKTNYPTTAIIMLTNHADAQSRAECMRSGADFFLDKSYEFEQLPTVVATLMQRVE
jgi:DNA-binding NarL/FixJ family response regulator